MQALMIAAPMLGLIGLGVATVGLFGRDPQAEEHDVADYRPAVVPVRVDEPDQPAPLPSAGAGRSIFAETAAALGVWPVDAEAVVAVVGRRYGDSPADIAARWLREAGEQARAELELAR